MRTTLSLDDDTLRLVKSYAEARSVSLGKAVDELVKRALTTPRATQTVNGLQVFVLAEDSPKISSNSVRDLAIDNE